MRPEVLTPGMLTRNRADLVNEQIEELTKLSSLTATYPLILDQTWCGWVISLDMDAILAGQTSNNPLTTTNPINPVVANVVNNFNTQGSTTINLTESSAATTITGLLPGIPGQTVTFQNNTEFPVYFTYLDSSSSTDGQFVTPTKTTLVIPPCHSQSFTYGKSTDQDKWAPTNPPVPYLPITPTIITTTTNNYNLDTAIVARITSDAERIITGIANPWPGRQLTLVNIGTNNIILTHEDALSTAINRFTLPHDQALTLRPDDSVALVYDGTTARWRVDAGTVPIKYGFDHYADAGNTSTGGTEDFVYVDAIAAGTLSKNGDKLIARYGGSVVGHATAVRTIAFRFGGGTSNKVHPGAEVFAATVSWVLDLLLIRVSATVVRYISSFKTDGLSPYAFSRVGEITGLTLSNANNLELGFTATGAGAAANDIVAKCGYVRLEPAV